MPQLSSLLRRRDTVSFLLILTALLCLFTLFGAPSPSNLYSSLPPFSLNPSRTSPPTDTHSPSSAAPPGPDALEVLSQLYEDERISLLRHYDQPEAEALVRTAHNALNPNFNAYITRLEDFVNTYFAESTHQPELLAMLDRLVAGNPPPLHTRPFEQRVFSFDKEGWQGVPDEFAYWQKRLEPEGWEIEVGDDAMMEEWYIEAVGGGDGTGPADDERREGGNIRVARTGKEKWDELWHGLGRAVLKSDLLRYLIMLTRGGLYTDSDTSVLSSPLKWGTHAHDLTPPGLRALLRASRHLDPAESDADDLASGPREETSLGMLNPKVSVVVSVEYDVRHPRQDPRVAYTRDLQIVQWTFLAKPFHPIFLDVLQTAISEILRRRHDPSATENWASILDGTGPGPFTDAVLRYLLVQYGVQPQDLVGMEDGALIGDVLILPLHAFGSYLGGEEDWEAHDPSTRCTAHGFRGRWKGEIPMQRRSNRWNRRAEMVPMTQPVFKPRPLEQDW